ncbi:DNA-binding response regulator [bacterium]|nr:MAG: DNA-binding response regulator [bacterium]
MTKISIMLSSRPKLLSEVIRNLIENQPDMMLAGEVVDPLELLPALRETPVNVVVITPIKANGMPRICGQLLKEHPQLRILTLTPESETVTIYQSGSQKTCSERPTSQLILDVIRESVGSGASSSCQEKRTDTTN